MNYTHFIGVDVSKETLDYCVLAQNKVLLEIKLPNNKVGIQQFVKELKGLGADVKECLFCMEHTGIYNNPLLYYCSEKGFAVWLESALQIKKSMGILRQKDDRADAKAIARYAYKNREEVKLWQAPRQVVSELKSLVAARARLLKASTALKQALKEQSSFISRKQAKMVESIFKNSLSGLKKDLLLVNQKIEEIIKSDEVLNRICNLIKSVDGVGPVTAWAVITSTNEFKSISCASKMACYSGVVPFTRSSGTSVNGKPRVSAIANKELKKLLHLSALSAIKMNGEMKAYFDRKQLEGKNKMLIINNVRNKLIRRVYACVLNNRPYEKNYSNLLFNP